MPAWMVAACVFQGLLFFVCAAAIVVLRFLRRGAARFAAAPAVVALLLLPVAFACAATAHALSNVLEALAVTGSGGIGAVSAGLAEALISLLFGFTSSAVLAFFGWVALAAGTSRATPGTEGSLPGAGGPVASFVAMGLTGCLVLLVWSLVNRASRLNMDGVAGRSVPFVLTGAALLFLLLAAMAVVGALKAARGRAPLPVALVSLALVAVLGAGSLGGLWLVFHRINCFSEAAATGKPCPELQDPDALPSVAAGVPSTNPSAEPPPPAIEEPAPEATPPPASTITPVRVGGRIREPHKVKNVPPLYPDIAKQARVQGIVILECTIDARGSVAEVRVLRGIPLLTEAAIDAVRQWRYEPTLLNGVPVPVIMTVTVNFRLG